MNSSIAASGAKCRIVNGTGVWPKQVTNVACESLVQKGGRIKFVIQIYT